MRESDLYEPMREWLDVYLRDRYRSHEIATAVANNERLDRVLKRYGVVNEMANGIDIQIDILGIATSGRGSRLFFIEAKTTRLTLRDLGQLWGYCRLVDPAEAFLMTSSDLGSLNRILNVFKREDLLDFGNGKTIKKMKIATWNTTAGSPNLGTMIPKL
jgi:hypothetical protein